MILPHLIFRLFERIRVVVCVLISGNNAFLSARYFRIETFNLFACAERML